MSTHFNRRITNNVITNKEFKSIQHRYLFGYWYEYYGRYDSKRNSPEKRIIQRSWKEHRKNQYKK